MADAYSTFVSIQPSATELMRRKGTKSLFERVRNEDAGPSSAVGTGAPPLLPAPSSSVSPGTYSNTITFSPVAGGASYNLYWSSAPGVTKNSAKIAGVSSPCVHPGLAGGATYYYAMATVSAAGEGPLGPEFFATATSAYSSPAISYPVLDAATNQNSAPPSVLARWHRCDLRATISNLYWSPTPGVSKGSSKISGITGYQQALTGIDYAKTYYLAVSSQAGSEESGLSNELSVTTQAYSFSVGTGSSGTVATNTISFGVYKADTLSMNIYWSLTPGVTKSSDKIAGVTSPYSHTPLACATDYYYAMSAVGPEGESDLSPEVKVTTPAASYMPSGAILKLDASDPTSWPGSGTQWKDLSGNGYHVNSVGTSYFATYNGNATFRSDGSTYKTVSTLNLGVPYTVLVVSRYNGLGVNNRGRIVSSSSTNWLHGFHSGRSGVYYANGWVANTGVYNENNWHCDITTGKTSGGNDFRLFHDGADISETPSSGTTGPGTISIGGYGSGEYSNADVAMILVWNRVLSATECSQAFDAVNTKFSILTQTDPLIDGATQALLKFEQTSTVTDSVTGAALTNYGTVALDANGRRGGKCADFNNAGYCYFPSTWYRVKNTFVGDCTVEGWLYYPTGRSGVFPEWFFYAGSSNSTSGRGVTAFVDWTNAYGGNKKIVWLLYPGADVQIVGADTAADTWTHFAFRRKYDSSAGNWLNEAWQNGVQVGSVRSAALATTVVSNVYVGSDYSSTAFAGKLDSLRISNKYRSDTEILSYFNNT